jgi:hypothetical protein
MRKRSWMSDEENATAGAARTLLRNMPDDARKAVLADVERNADDGAKREIRDILQTEEILGRRR